MMTDEWITIIEHAEELTEILLSSEVVEDYNKAHEAVYSMNPSEVDKRFRGNERTL